MIEIKMYPAKNGDCFLLSFGISKKNHILIDCGYVDTYERFLKKDLLDIAKKKEKINLMIITHIDADHISGAIKFIQDNDNEKFIEIEEVWFNAYRHLQTHKENGTELHIKETEILEREIALGKSYFKRVNQSEIVTDEISAKQGSTLGALLLKGNYNWNTKFNGNAVSTNINESISIEGVSITILSPDEQKLKKLESKWIKELKKKKWNFYINENKLFDDAYEFMLLLGENEYIVTSNEISKQKTKESLNVEGFIEKEYEMDHGDINGSSIAILIEYDEKKLLFLADAHPDIISNKLIKMGKTKFDLVKVSHHGSIKNTNNELAKVMNSNRYLFSTNGHKHRHPDSQTIIKLLFANSQSEKQLYFNYETDTSKLFESKELQQKYNYETITGNGEEPIVIEL
ncbi:MBL fold metallo-hydrolase [Peribacillus simplex]|uniref:Metallo-beta-lactamase superfamily protein n=1 Tax=Peribacillus simplex TaxID=1478 RepID=A0AAN2TPW3_9BACI|nr:MBL fold metallo-hydrolase [Peribacillus simplex]CEG24558.1 Metallo-beta-lactamase superfamily protein [Peribacillus simplex]